MTPAEDKERDRLFNLAVSYIEVRLRSRQEMVDYLNRKGASAEGCGLVLGRLEELGLIDDAVFAAAWIASRQALKPSSRRRLDQELRQKGVAKEVVAAALNDTEEGAEYVAVLEVAAKKYRLPQYREAEKLTAYLARQGYPYDLVKRAVVAVRNSED